MRKLRKIRRRLMVAIGVLLVCATVAVVYLFTNPSNAEREQQGGFVRLALKLETLLRERT